MQQRYTFIIVALLAVLLLTGCGSLPGADVVEARNSGLPLAEGKPASDAGAKADATMAFEEGFAACPVTLPGEQPFGPPEPYPETYPYEGRTWYGSASLWTALPDDGRWDQLLHGDKAFWWREGYSASDEPQPRLWMTATRLDGAGSVEQEPPATNAYHRDFHWAMLTGFGVPEAGCWEITGHYDVEGEVQSLRFVVFVSPAATGREGSVIHSLHDPAYNRPSP